MHLFDDVAGYLRWMRVDRSGCWYNRLIFINDWLVLLCRLVLRRCRDLELWHVILMGLVSFGEEWIGFRIENRQVHGIVVGYADVIIEVAETVIGILSDGCLLLAHHGFVLVNDFLNDFEDVGIEVQVQFFRLDYGLYQVILLGLLLMIVLQTMEHFLIDLAFLSLPSMLLDVFIFLTYLVF